MHQILKARDEEVQNTEESITVLNYLAAVLSVVQAACPGDTFRVSSSSNYFHNKAKLLFAFLTLNVSQVYDLSFQGYITCGRKTDWMQKHTGEREDSILLS